MFLIYICDDEPAFLADIAKIVSGLIPGGNVRTFLSAQDLLKSLQANPCDILLLDIDMPEINGLDAAKKLMSMDEKPLLIFVTSYDELVYDSLHYHPFGFIRKSFLKTEIEKMMADCMKNIAERERYFYFKGSDGNTRISLADVLYFEGDGNYMKLYTAERKYRFRDTIAAVEDSLSDEGFIRIHKGFLINQAAVMMLRSEEVELTGGYTVPIGKGYAGAAKNRLMRYMMR